MQTLADCFLVGYPYDSEWHTPNVQAVSVYVDQLERQADAAPSPYQLAMTGAKVAPASAAKGVAGGLGRDRTVKTQPAPEKPEPSEKPERMADQGERRFPLTITYYGCPSLVQPLSIDAGQCCVNSRRAHLL